MYIRIPNLEDKVYVRGWSLGLASYMPADCIEKSVP